jgi:hypothetical protein
MGDAAHGIRACHPAGACRHADNASPRDEIPQHSRESIGQAFDGCCAGRCHAPSIGIGIPLGHSQSRGKSRFPGPRPRPLLAECITVFEDSKQLGGPTRPASDIATAEGRAGRFRRSSDSADPLPFAGSRGVRLPPGTFAGRRVPCLAGPRGLLPAPLRGDGCLRGVDPEPRPGATGGLRIRNW